MTLVKRYFVSLGVQNLEMCIQIWFDSKVASFELHRHTSKAASKPVSNLLTTGSCKNRFSTAAIKESLQGTL